MFARTRLFKRKQSTMPNLPCPNADGSSPRQTKFDAPPPMCIDPAKTYSAEMVTSMGTMTISLDASSAPKTVNSFVFLARYHYFEGIIFHRIINGFVCQGGDPTGTGTGGPGYRFEDELPKAGRYEIGSLAMANAGPNTNGSQFFLISGQQGVRLPPQYSLFGKVVKGLEVVDAMQKVETDRRDKPVNDVVIQSVTITEQ
jgi:cyclophilin family peptidyl-prolyl cis-trans isomerase